METETATWSKFPNGGKAIVEQILASEERNKSKRAGLWESLSGIRVGKLSISERSFGIEKVYQSSPDLSVPPEWVSQSLWWMLIRSQKTNTFADGLTERSLPILDEIESKRDEEDERSLWIFVKLSFSELCNSKLSGLHAFDNMAIIH